MKKPKMDKCIRNYFILAIFVCIAGFAIPTIIGNRIAERQLEVHSYNMSRTQENFQETLNARFLEALEPFQEVFQSLVKEVENHIQVSRFIREHSAYLHLHLPRYENGMRAVGNHKINP